MKTELDKEQMHNLIELGYDCSDASYEYVKYGQYEKIGFAGIVWSNECLKPKSMDVNCIVESIIPCYTIGDLYDKFESYELNSLKHDKNGWKFTSIEHNITLKEDELIDILYKILINIKIAK